MNRPRVPKQVPRRDGLSIIDPTRGDELVDLLRFEPHHLDLLPRFQPVRYLGQLRGMEGVDSLIRAPGRGQETSQLTQAGGGSSHFLLELTACGIPGPLTGLQLAGTEFEKEPGNREATDPDHEDRSVAVLRNHRDRAGVFDEFLADTPPLGVEVVDLPDPEDGASMDKLSVGIAATGRPIVIS